MVTKNAFIKLSEQVSARHSSSFAPTSHALRLMETLAAAVQAREPILLVSFQFKLSIQLYRLFDWWIMVDSLKDGIRNTVMSLNHIYVDNIR